MTDHRETPFSRKAHAQNRDAVRSYPKPLGGAQRCLLSISQRQFLQKAAGKSGDRPLTHGQDAPESPGLRRSKHLAWSAALGVRSAARRAVVGTFTTPKKRAAQDLRLPRFSASVACKATKGRRFKQRRLPDSGQTFRPGRTWPVGHRQYGRGPPSLPFAKSGLWRLPVHGWPRGWRVARSRSS